jgi:hypothetical protein
MITKPKAGEVILYNTLEEYLLFDYLENCSNIHKKTRLQTAYSLKQLFEQTIAQGFAILGSTIYGDKKTFTTPNKNSDIDCQLITDNFAFPKELQKYFSIDPELIQLFNNSEIDILAIKGKIKKIDISIHAIHSSTYSNICALKNTNLVVGRTTPTKETVNVSGYKHKYLSKAKSRPFKNSFIYLYPHDPFEKNDFVPKLYHQMILNSILLFDKTNLTNLRQEMTFLIKTSKEKIAPCANAINIFRPKSNFWSQTYKKLIETELTTGVIT